MRAAPLPRRAGQGGADGVGQAAVGIGDDQPHPGQATGGQPGQEPQPARAVLLRGDVQAEDFALPVAVDPDRFSMMALPLSAVPADGRPMTPEAV